MAIITFGEWLLSAAAAAAVLARLIRVSRTFGLLVSIPALLVLFAVMPTSSDPQPPRKVAIVEDDVSYQELWQEALADAVSGVQVVVFPSCEALIATGFDYGLFIVDHHLTGAIDGLECIWRIRHDNPGAVIVFYPGDADRKVNGARVGDLAVEMGANLVFEKGSSILQAMAVILKSLSW